MFLNRNEKKHKINWRSGTGELLGFACIAPILTLMICAIATVAQISIMSQQLLYTAYATGRAAVVSDTEELAEARASSVLNTMFPGAGLSFVSSSESLSYSQVSYAAANNVYCTIQYMSKGADPDRGPWQKGNAVKCTTYRYLQVLMPFSSGTRTQSIVMMIENEESKTKTTQGVLLD